MMLYELVVGIILISAISIIIGLIILATVSIVIDGEAELKVAGGILVSMQLICLGGIICIILHGVMHIPVYESFDHFWKLCIKFWETEI